MSGKITTDPKPAPTYSPAAAFPFIGLGASAGGLEALKTFFSKVTGNSGMAYFVMVHRSPKQPSMMSELLQKVSPIPIAEAEDDQVIEADHVYVVPPDRDLTIQGSRIRLVERDHASALSIDLFFRSLAEDQGKNAAAIILSGTGTDGTMGIRAIKGNEGLVLVQNKETAAYDGMPRSAGETGLADLILPPEAMPEQLVRYFSSHKKSHGPGSGEAGQDVTNRIFAILRARTGHDFSGYKAKTIQRRISRRMVVNQIDNHKGYVDYLQKFPEETEALFRELLIGVTQFFRDPESFEVLKSAILPDYLNSLKEGATFRAWVPGCSTGEEVYSLAMVLHECLDRHPMRLNLQLFGTDIDNRAVAQARQAVYPAGIEADVGADRLNRFFIKEGNEFRIRKELRDDLVFSDQNLLRDPPFLHLDMLSCRNLLIYLNNETQQKIIPLFHYSLVPDGILMLGSSETISRFSNLFETRDKKWRIFRRRVSPAQHRPIVFPIGQAAAEPAEQRALVPTYQKPTLAHSTRTAILDQFAPTAILIDAQGDIQHVQGRTGKYLETPSGRPTSNILNLAREGLRIELSAALRKASSSNITVTRRHVAVRTNGDTQIINLHVAPQHAKDLKGHLLVVLEDVDEPAAGSRTDSGHVPLTESPRLIELEDELLNYQESHKVIIEELESANEELKSANEELQSANEELQSANEEQESAKEELQSLNEELQTVNAELESKIAELSEAHDDLHNLLNGTQIATIFVDNELRIRSFTEAATTIVNLIQSDVGRPLKHVATNLEYQDMLTDLSQVLKELSAKTAEVRTTGGGWYTMRIMPYRTRDNHINGAVLTFADIGEQKTAQAKIRAAGQEAEQAMELVRHVFDMNTAPMAVLDQNDKLVIANSVFSSLFNIDQREIKGLDLIGLQRRVFNSIELKPILEKALEHNRDFTSPPFELKTAGGSRTFFIHGRIVKRDEQFPYRILLHFRESSAKE
jgi:two-component system CheB/CheR fusion protein